MFSFFFDCRSVLIETVGNFLDTLNTFPSTASGLAVQQSPPDGDAGFVVTSDEALFLLQCQILPTIGWPLLITFSSSNSSNDNKANQDRETGFHFEVN